MSHSQQTALDRFYNEFQPLTDKQEQEFFKTVREFYNSDKNINMKTDIKNPPLHSALDLYVLYLKDIGCKDGSRYTEKYSLWLKEQMVSDNRKGRGEFGSIMASKLQQVVRNTWDRLTGKHHEGSE